MSHSFWFFDADKPAVQLMKGSDESGLYKKLLKCKFVGYATCSTKRCSYTIWFNDNGIYEESKTNTAARQVLGKLKIPFGTMKGNFIVDAFNINDGETIDMPKIDFKTFIQEVNENL
jgi:hypothetical protein